MLALLAPIAAALAIGGLVVANSAAQAASSPAKVAPPSEPASQLTINVNADGTLSLPFRATLACDSSVCPAGLSYTDIAPGRTYIVVNDPSGTKAQVQFGKVVGRHVGPGNKQAHARTALRAGSLTVSVTMSNHKVARLVLFVMPDPYQTSSSSSSSSSSSVPTTGNPKVVVTLDPGGEGGVLKVEPSDVPAGNVDVQFVVPDPVGSPGLNLEVQPKVGTHKIANANETQTVLLCPHDWILRVIFQDNQYTTTTMATGYTGPLAFLNATGSSPLCTTPIT